MFEGAVEVEGAEEVESKRETVDDGFSEDGTDVQIGTAVCDQLLLIHSATWGDVVLLTLPSSQ